MNSAVKKYVVISCCILWSCLIMQPSYAVRHIRCLQNQNKFGILASSPLLDMIPQDDLKPIISHTGKSLVTYNHYGFDVLDDSTLATSWLVQDLDTFSKTASKPILEVGGGYGRLSKVLLNNNATVVLNDLDERHLLLARKEIPIILREHLYLNTHRFPRNMILPAQCVSAVVFHRVLHFMSADEIEEGFAKINKWLIPGGKIYIAVLPPQHSEYQAKVLANYNQRWQKGDSWPGTGMKAATLLPDQAYALPQHIHVMDERPLKTALEKYGFIVEKSGYIEMTKFGHTKMRQGTELFGIIATKPK